MNVPWATLRWAAGTVRTSDGCSSPQPPTASATTATRGVVRCSRMPKQILGIIAAFVATSALALPASAQALTVYAATSLTEVMSRIDRGATYSFGGSNTLQLQIERGAPADLFLAAEPTKAQALYRKGR